MRGISPQFALDPFIGSMKITSAGHQKSEFFRPPLHLFSLRLIMGRMIVLDSFQPRLHKTGNEIVIILLSGMSQNRGSAVAAYGLHALLRPRIFDIKITRASVFKNFLIHIAEYSVSLSRLQQIGQYMLFVNTAQWYSRAALISPSV